jgi:hypothetical protein
MPRFFFHLRDDMIVDDDEGQELPDLAAAHAVAIQEARIQMCETMRKGRMTLHHWIEISDEDGRMVDKVLFGEAVEIEG